MKQHKTVEIELGRNSHFIGLGLFHHEVNQDFNRKIYIANLVVLPWVFRHGIPYYQKKR